MNNPGQLFRILLMNLLVTPQRFSTALAVRKFCIKQINRFNIYTSSDRPTPPSVVREDFGGSLFE